MLICSVSQRPPRRAIAAELVEAAAADDAATTGTLVLATLVDDPANVLDTLDAFTGEIMLEAASAAVTVDSGFVSEGAITEAASAADDQTASVTAGAVTTWNPSDKTANITLSNGNLTAQNTDGTNSAARGTTSKSSGKHYFEV